MSHAACFGLSEGTCVEWVSIADNFWLFFEERIRNLLRDKGISPDIAEASLSVFGGTTSINSVWQSALALNTFINTDHGKKPAGGNKTRRQHSGCRSQERHQDRRCR